MQRARWPPPLRALCCSDKPLTVPAEVVSSDFIHDSRSSVVRRGAEVVVQCYSDAPTRLPCAQFDANAGISLNDSFVKLVAWVSFVAAHVVPPVCNLFHFASLTPLRLLATWPAVR